MTEQAIQPKDHHMLSALTSLFDAKARRERQRDTYQAEIAQLRREFEAAIAAGDDAAAEKIAARWDKAEAALRGVVRIIEATQKEAAEQERKARAAARAAQAQELRTMLRTGAAMAVRLDEAQGALAPEWLAFFAFMEAYREKASAYGFPADIPRDLMPHTVWTRTFLRFTSATQRPEREPMLLPQGGSRSRHIESVAESLAEFLTDQPEEVE